MSDSSTDIPVIIHVGLPKSASTFIKGEYFSRMTRNAIVPRGELWAALQNDGELFDRLIQPYIRDASDGLVLCSENFSGTFWDDNCAATVADNLKNSFPNARVLLILREQFDYIRSAYGFCITKGYHTPSLDKLLRYRGDDLIRKLTYSQLVSMYFEKFGRENVLVMPFEQLKADSESFKSALTDFCQMPLRYEGISSRKNVSIKGHKLLTALQRVGQLTWPLIRIERAIDKILHKPDCSLYSDGSYTVSQRVITAIVKRFVSESDQPLEINEEFTQKASPVFKASNAACSELLGVDLGRYGYIM